MIDFSCNCGQVISVPETAAGKTGKCRKCGVKVHVPTPEAVSEISIPEPEPEAPFEVEEIPMTEEPVEAETKPLPRMRPRARRGSRKGSSSRPIRKLTAGVGEELIQVSISYAPSSSDRGIRRAVIAHWLCAGLLLLMALLMLMGMVAGGNNSQGPEKALGAGMMVFMGTFGLLIIFGPSILLQVLLAVFLAKEKRLAMALSLAQWFWMALSFAFGTFWLLLSGMWGLIMVAPIAGIINLVFMLIFAGLTLLGYWLASGLHNLSVWRKFAGGGS